MPATEALLRGREPSIFKKSQNGFVKTEAGDIDFTRLHTTTMVRSQRVPPAQLLHIYGANQSSRNIAPRQALKRAITKYPPCRRWRLLRPREVVATAAIAPAIGSNPANTQTPETPHEMHLYETERAPHRR